MRNNELIEKLDELSSSMNQLEKIQQELNEENDKLKKAQEYCSSFRAPSEKEYIKIAYKSISTPKRPRNYYLESGCCSFSHFIYVDCGTLGDTIDGVALNIGLGCLPYLICWPLAAIISIPIWIVKFIFMFLFKYLLVTVPKKKRYERKLKLETEEYEKKLEQINDKNQKRLEKVKSDYRKTNWDSFVSTQISAKKAEIEQINIKIESLACAKDTAEAKILRYESEIGLPQTTDTGIIGIIKDILCKEENSSLTEALKKAQQISMEKQELFDELCNYFENMPIPDGGVYWNDKLERLDFKASVLIGDYFAFKKDSVSVSLSTIESGSQPNFYRASFPIPEVLRDVKLVDDFKTYFYKCISRWEKYLRRYEIMNNDMLCFRFVPTDQYWPNYDQAKWYLSENKQH